jgi:two-component system, NtrC family, response regulator HydG
MALKLLIIHSDDPFRKHLSERMRLEKYLVFEASRESEASDMIQQGNFDVVLLGVAGPYQHSLSFLKVIKETQPYTEVILLTALEEHSLYASIQAMQLGAFDDLLVPLDINTLHSRIREAYKRKKERVKAKRFAIIEGRENRTAG